MAAAATVLGASRAVLSAGAIHVGTTRWHPASSATRPMGGGAAGVVAARRSGGGVFVAVSVAASTGGRRAAARVAGGGAAAFPRQQQQQQQQRRTLASRPQQKELNFRCRGVGGSGGGEGGGAGRRDADPDTATAVVAAPPVAVDAVAVVNRSWDKWVVGKVGLATLGLGSAFGSGFDIDGPASTVEAVLVLASIIFVHECGHFLAARTQGIHVSKFSVGFGPNLIAYKGPEVEYSLRAIPLGGFVAFPDDDPDCPYPADDPDLLRNRPIKDRALVIGAGVTANVIFALAILLTQVNTVGFNEQSFQPGVKVSQLLSTSAAKDYGIRVGDVILAVNGEVLGSSGGSVNTVVERVRASGATPLHFDIERGAGKGAAAGAPRERLSLDVKPNTAPSGEGRIGVQLEANAEIHKRKAKDTFDAVSLAGQEFTRLTYLVTKSLFSLVSNFQAAKENVSGPIAIVGVGAEVMRGSDLSGLYSFASVININLAVVNILPLPALDGGYLFLIGLEALRGKKLNTELEQTITASGVILLAGSGIFLILRDTVNLITGLHL